MLLVVICLATNSINYDICLSNHCRAPTAEAYILSANYGAYLEGYAASLRPIAGKNSAES